MEFDANLFNAAIIAENPEMSFIVKDNRLHAVEPSVASLHIGTDDHEKLLPLMREALNQLLVFAKDKIPSQVASVQKMVSLKTSEYDQLVDKIEKLYHHLPHHFRNDLSSLIHHKLKK